MITSVYTVYEGGGGGGALAGDPCCPLWGSSGGMFPDPVLPVLPPEAVLLLGNESESALPNFEGAFYKSF